MATNEDRDYDIVILGASGFTGRFMVEELAKSSEGKKWCIAGRDMEKLKTVLKEVGDIVGVDLQKIEIIQANVRMRDTLTNMCKRTKLVLNCVGPYRFYGEKVVEECVKNKTHYVDVSGEPQFLEKMQLQYFKEAKENQVYIVGSCGFDSIPTDLGVEIVKRKFDGDVNSVESYLQMNSSGTTVNFATWQSAVHGLAHADELKPLRKKLKEAIFTKKISRGYFPATSRPVLFRSKEVKSWCVPFIGSDKSVVLRTQAYNYQFKNERPVQMQAYMCMKSLLYALVTLFMGLIFTVLARFSFGRHLLESYPEIFSLGVFSKSPPVREKLFGNTFSITFKAHGWSEKLAEPEDRHTHSPDKTLTVVLNGPDPGYVTTSICAINSCLVILDEADKMPDVGGVLTPGAAFKNSTLQERLEKRGIKYTVVGP